MVYANDDESLIDAEVNLTFVVLVTTIEIET